MSWLHSYCGLVFGWVLFGVLLTGSLAVFYTEINLWAAPEVRSPLRIDRAHAIGLGRRYLTEKAPDARQWRIVIPTPREPVLRLVWTDAKGKATTHRLDPVTGARIPRDMDAGFFFMRYHYTLGVDRTTSPIGFLAVGAAGLAMLAASVSGIIIHKRIFRDFFIFRPASSQQRAWMDAHNILSVLPLPFHMMMAFTGLILIYYAYIPAGVNMLYAGDAKAYQRDAAQSLYVDVKTAPGLPSRTVDLPPLVERAERAWGGGPAVNIYISHPDRSNAAVEIWRQRDDRLSNFPDRVAFEGRSGRILRVLMRRSAAREAQSLLAGLHFIEWGGIWARWLYFILGLCSAAMVAAALVLFIAKREAKHAKRSALLLMAKPITVASVAGNMIACAVYLHAERIVAPDAEGRRSLMATAFFLSWLLCLVHAALRGYASAWREQLAVGGLLCLALPVSSAMANVGLAQTIGQGDWIRASADLVMLAFGVTLLATAAWMKRGLGAAA
ncbi:MAG: PepSY-associated TM helix domain-containing protein [Sphingobium sp.]